MNIFDTVISSFNDPLIEYRVKNKADEIFGYSNSYIKNLYIVDEYKNMGGLLEGEFSYKDYRISKSFIDEQMSFTTNNWFIRSELEYAAEMLDSQ